MILDEETKEEGASAPKDDPDLSDSFFVDEPEPEVESEEATAEDEPADPEVEAAAAATDEDDEDDDEDDEPKDKLPRSVYQKIQRARMKRDAAKAEADAARAEAAALRAQIEEMKDPEPDIDDDPHAWKAWKERDVARKMGAPAARGAQPANGAPPAGTDPRGAELAAIREAFRREHPDYDRFVNPAVLREIDNDPVVYDIVWVQGKDNPVKAAYEYGKRRILGQPKKPEASGGGSGFASPRAGAGRGGKITELAPWQKAMARKFNMTEKQMLEDLNAEAAREK